VNRYASKQANDLYVKLMAASDIELDASERLLIPTEQRHHINIGKDIVLVGMDKCIEIWDATAYDNSIHTNDEELMSLHAALFGKTIDDKIE
jgi:MraZ protein